MDIDTYDDHPNFSVIVPQSCNAHCEFCSNADIEPDDGSWLDKLRIVIGKIPLQFRSVSITGGEPTLYGDLEETMFWLRKRFEKVVVSTNGAKLGEMGFVLRYANAVNLSWHGWNTAEAIGVFGAEDMEGEPDQNAIEFLRENGTGVTLTWVVVKARGLTAKDVTKYMALAEKLGCSAAAFRYDMREHDGLEGGWIPALPASFSMESEGGCPACRTWRFEQRGFPVFFKASVVEPIDIIRAPYELVFTSKGILSYDWAGRRPVEEKNMTKHDEDRLDRLEVMVERLTKVVLNDKNSDKTEGVPERSSYYVYGSGATRRREAGSRSCGGASGSSCTSLGHC
jgi:pyruvate-formate lyase-activating enzyme